MKINYKDAKEILRSLISANSSAWSVTTGVPPNSDPMMISFNLQTQILEQAGIVNAKTEIDINPENWLLPRSPGTTVFSTPAAPATVPIPYPVFPPVNSSPQFPWPFNGSSGSAPPQFPWPFNGGSGSAPQQFPWPFNSGLGSANPSFPWPAMPGGFGTGGSFPFPWPSGGGFGGGSFPFPLPFGGDPSSMVRIMECIRKCICDCGCNDTKTETPGADPSAQINAAISYADQRLKEAIAAGDKEAKAYWQKILDQAKQGKEDLKKAAETAGKAADEFKEAADNFKSTGEKAAKTLTEYLPHF